MGGCVSRPDRCVGRKSPPARASASSTAGGTRHRRRRAFRRRVAASNKGMGTIEELDCRPYSTPALQVNGSVDEAWYDSCAVIESDEEEFQSVQEDAFSLNGYEGEVVVSSSSSKEINIGIVDAHSASIHPVDLHRNGRKSLDQNVGNVENSTKPYVSHDDLSILSDDGAGHNGGIMDNCGIIPSNCLPCLVTAIPTNDKRKVSSPLNSAKKPSLRLSFKRRSVDGNTFSARFSAKAVVERPLAGSQVKFCLTDKKILDSWSEIEPSTFRVRGENYFRDKKKVLAPNYAVYYPFGVDVYMCQQKISHIARFVELPTTNMTGKLPPFLIVNVQIPLYPAALFQSETDGEGFSIVLYFKLSESYMKELPAQFLENLHRLIDDEVERVKGFPMDTILAFRERLKILGRVVNVDDLPMSAAERKIMHAYNEKPVLSRPQHEFYLGENYFEIDIDMHRFSFISRKGFETFIDRLKLCILDVGLTIQGIKPEEVPENVLCCVRLNGIDYTNYPQLAVHYP